MSKKVFLYPSNQWANLYAYGGTNEGEQMNLVADKIEDKLKSYDVLVLRSDNAKNYIEGCYRVNKENPDLCLCIHSNAFNGSVTGTETLYSPFVKGSSQFAQLLQNKLVPLMPSNDRGIVNGTYPAGRNIGYMNRIKCVTALTEVEYHDVPYVAKWIVDNKERIAATLTEAVVDFLSLNLKNDTAANIPAYLTVSTRVLPLILNGGFDIRKGIAKGPAIARMPKGVRVELLEKTNGKWYRVKYNGLTGYASSAYLR